MALDEYSSTFGEARLFEITARALTRAFRYFETVEEGVNRLSELQNKLTNPEFYNSSHHPHARVSEDGQPIPGPWNDIQYDSAARTVIALAKHMALTRDESTFKKCEAGLKISLKYLFDSVWDRSDNRARLTVCANEWEEKEEPHLRSPLFSSVTGLLCAASRYGLTLEEYVQIKDIDLKECQKQTESMLREFFIRDGVIKMIKRYEEPPTGNCSSSLWLLTTYDIAPVKSQTFENTINTLTESNYLSVELDLKDNPGRKGRVLRRYEITQNDNERGNKSTYVDHYWGGQAWIITTAQLATGFAKRGDLERAQDLFNLCLQARSDDGKLPEQFPGTFYDPSRYAEWKEWSRSNTPAPWLAWSHAEVIRAYTSICNAN
jgi:GH15 family glucan-1,4-alpha-glucosidase